MATETLKTGIKVQGILVTVIFVANTVFAKINVEIF